MRTPPPQLALLALIVCAAPAAAQTKSVKFEELGIKLAVPRTYEALAIEPEEEWLVLSYIETKRKRNRDARRVRPGFHIAVIPADLEELQVLADEGAEPRPAITDYESYVRHAWPDWRLSRPGPVDEVKGFETQAFRMFSPEERLADRRGWAHVWKGADRTVVWLGFCGEEDYEEVTGLWVDAARRTEFFAAESNPFAERRMRRIYQRNGIKDPDYRIAVRKKLASGWNSLDTKNYILVYNTQDAELVIRVARDIEIVREHYATLFPPTVLVETVATVRICKDRSQYVASGGNALNAGHWNAAAEELVLYDASDVRDSVNTSAKDTFYALYHEAFHQYIHHSAGGLAPHPWFDEGLGDYFAAAVIRNGAVREVGINRWRVAEARRYLLDGNHVPWRELLLWSTQVFQDPETRSRNYSQAWSIAYFLNDERTTRENPEWADLLPKYLRELRRTYDEELALIGGTDEEGKAAAVARSRAIDNMLDGVDLDGIERAWARFVLKLKDE